MSSRIFKTRLIVYRKNDYYLAIALDFDLMDQGSTFAETLGRLDKNIRSYLSACLVEGESDTEIYRQASKKYQDMFDMFEEWEKNKRNSDRMVGVTSIRQEQLVHG